jgi:hypothetical protein
LWFPFIHSYTHTPGYTIHTYTGIHSYTRTPGYTIHTYTGIHDASHYIYHTHVYSIHPSPTDKKDVYLVEEYKGPPHGVSNAHWFSWASIHKCYGKAAHDSYKDTPMLCSG